MKTFTNQISINPRVCHASAIALLITLSGCANAPLRQQTAEFDLVSSLDLPTDVARPVAVHTIAPEYPDRMICAGIEGEVWVRCWVDQYGETQEVAAYGASLPDFADAAVAAVKKWTFTPGTREGRPLGMWVSIPFHFTPKYPPQSTIDRW